MKTPKFLSKLSAVLTPRPKKKLQAMARTAPRAAMNEYEAEEPTTKLVSAFMVVLVLHLVAVGGIYMFNSIKASRVSRELSVAPAAEKARPAAANAVKTPVQTVATPKATPRAATAHPADNVPAAAPVPAVVNQKTGTPRQYPVKANDNPTKIAGAFNIKTEELLAANNLKDGAILQPGQLLIIPTPKPATKPVVAEPRKTDLAAKQSDVPPTRTTPGVHVVKSGETMTSIAKKYGLTPDALLKLNKITDAKKLQLGQTLTLPKKKG